MALPMKTHIYRNSGTTVTTAHLAFPFQLAAIEFEIHFQKENIISASREDCKFSTTAH